MSIEQPFTVTGDLTHDLRLLGDNKQRAAIVERAIARIKELERERKILLETGLKVATAAEEDTAKLQSYRELAEMVKNSDPEDTVVDGYIRVEKWNPIHAKAREVLETLEPK